MKIEVKNLTKKFNNFLAVDNISFSIEKNKIVGLLGPNGCGKTTSIGMMLGLIKPCNGNIFINDKDLNKINKYEILEKINFASPYIELPKKLTVKENLEIYARLYTVKNFNNRIDEIINDLYGLKHFLQEQNITFANYGTSKSSKKELHKIIDKIMSWEISSYTSYLKKS